MTTKRLKSHIIYTWHETEYRESWSHWRAKDILQQDKLSFAKPASLFQSLTDVFKTMSRFLFYRLFMLSEQCSIHDLVNTKSHKIRTVQQTRATKTGPQSWHCSLSVDAFTLKLKPSKFPACCSTEPKQYTYWTWRAVGWLCEAGRLFSCIKPLLIRKGIENTLQGVSWIPAVTGRLASRLIPSGYNICWTCLSSSILITILFAHLFHVSPLHRKRKQGTLFSYPSVF